MMKQQKADVLQNVSPQGTLKIPHPTENFTTKSHQKQAPITITDEAGRVRRVGVVSGNRLVKSVIPGRHRLRMAGGCYAVQSQLLDSLPALGVEVVEVREKSGNVFLAELEAFREHGIVVSLGCGRQIALPLRRWVCVVGDGR